MYYEKAKKTQISLAIPSLFFKFISFRVQLAQIDSLFFMSLDRENNIITLYLVSVSSTYTLCVSRCAQVNYVVHNVSLRKSEFHLYVMSHCVQ